MTTKTVQRRSVRTLQWITGITGAALALTACGADGGNPAVDASGDNGPASQEGEASISYWLWDSNQLPAYQQCAADFEAESGIAVEIEQYGWGDYWQGLSTGFASQTAPDVFTNHLSYYPEFVAQGQVLSISERIEADGLDMTIYQDGLADLWQDEEGLRYGLPKDFDTVALFVNEAMAGEAGVDLAELGTAEWNPADGGSFEAAIAKLTLDENGVRGDEPGFDPSKVAVHGLALSGNGLNASGQQTFAPFALSNNWYFGDKTPWTTEFYFDEPEFLETMEWFRSLIEKGYMAPAEVALSELDPMNGYLAGRYAVVIDGSWMNGSYLGQDDIPTKAVPTPIGPSGERASVFNGLADGIWAGTENPDAAWEWVKYLGSAACQDVVAESAVVLPAIKSSTQKANEAFAERGWDVSAFTVQVDEGTTALLPIAKQWPEVNDTFSSELERFLTGSGDVDGFVAVNERINGLFN